MIDVSREKCSKLQTINTFRFSCLVPFPQIFGQVKEWLMIELHKIIRMSHVVACPIVFALIYERGCQGRVFKVIKNDLFLVFLAVSGLFPKFLAG